jgi:hypothetical protein
MPLHPLRMEMCAVAAIAALSLPPLPTFGGKHHHGRTGGQPAVAGNIRISVPAVPRHQDLRPLCQAFLDRAEPGREGAQSRRRLDRSWPVANADREHLLGEALLVGATGGSETRTTRWCRIFLAPPPQG